MAKYVKGKDGKFAGSIGDGKTKVPTAAPKPAPLVGVPSNVKTPQDVDKLVAKMRKSLSEEFVPHDDIIVTDWRDANGTFVSYDLDGSPYHASAFADTHDPDLWVASICADVPGNTREISSEEFDTKNEALAWMQDNLMARQEELDLFEAKLDENPEALHRALERHVRALGTQFITETGVYKDRTLYAYEDREAEVRGYGPNEYEVTVERYDLQADGTLHLRTFGDQETAHDFARAMVLLVDR